MRYNPSFLRPFFLRQLDADDCGTACLGMLLRVSGMPVTGALLRKIPVPPGGLSLLDLRQEASRFGIHGRCVRMDLETLSGMDVPVILLMENVFSERHYCLCFGSRSRLGKRVFLLADPATEIHYLPEEELKSRWRDGLGIYFPDFPEPTRAIKGTPSLFGLLALVPSLVWAVLPVLTLMQAACAMAVYAVLQKMSAISDFQQAGALIFAGLLLIAGIGRSMLNYIRSLILQKLQVAFHSALFSSADSPSGMFSRDMESIRNGVLNVSGALLSEGCLLLAAVFTLFFINAVAGLICLVYLGTVMIIVNLSLSGIMHELAQSGQAGQRIHARRNVEMASDEQHGFSLRALLSLVFTGKRYQRANLSVEIAGTLGFLVLFIYAAGGLSRGELTSAGFFILSITAYFISALVPRITAAIPAITQAEQALAQIRFYAKDVH